VKLTAFIEAIERALGKKAQWKLMPIQAGDVEKTWADVSSLKQDYAYNPGTPVETGIERFIDWYRAYYRV
jgi:UDP-glucuronate 4-epimerase